MKKNRLNIGGPKGNVFYVLGTVATLGKQMNMTSDEIADIQSCMKGDIFSALGGTGNDYEGVLQEFLKHFPFVELYSTIELGIDPTLYTLYEEPEIFEL